ncbi:MAG: peptidylprolyl isomerase [Paracoccaceae bacterium]
MRRGFLKTLAAVALAATAGFAVHAQEDIDPENVLVIEIGGENPGIVEILLRPDLAPLHIAQIKALARAGSYDGVAFHRVIDGFMAQTGDVKYGQVEGFDYRQAGFGQSELPDIPAEFSDIAYVEGIIGMARGGDPNSANSQFFIMLSEYSSLNGKYTVIGRVISGMDIVHGIKKGSSADNGSVFEDPGYMASVRVKSDL